MKIFSAIIIIIFASTIFYSCKDNPVTLTPEGFKWQLSDSLQGEYIEGMYAPDLYTLYYFNISSCYKTLYGAKTKIDFGDATFRVVAMNAFSPTYTAFIGTSGTPTSRVTLKIINNGIVTTALLDSNPTALSSNVLILQPGKIIFSFENKLHFYDNGTITTYLPESKDDTFYRLVNTDNVIYLSAFTLPGGSKIYKFENNVLSLIATQTSGNINMQVDDFMLKSDVTSQASTVSYLTSGGWMQLCADSANIRFYEASGENINLVYFLTFTSNEGYKAGSYWNGTSLVRDDKFPFKGTDSEFRIMSNMNSRTIYVSKRVNGTSYIYKGYIPESY